MLKRLIFSLFIALLVTALPLPAHAQSPAAANEGINLQISPLPIEINAKPGASVSTDLRVRNAGTKDQQLRVRLLSVRQDNNGVVHLSQPRASDEWVKWVSFSRDQFNAPPGEWQTIKMTVSLPDSAAFGYYFAVEYLPAKAPVPQPGKAVASGAVATFILLNAEAPGASRQAKIVNFSVDRKSYEFLPANFTLKVASTGNVHVAPHGNIFISRGGKQVGAIPVNAASGKVLPGGSRFFSAAWSDGFPVYTAKQQNGQVVIGKDGQPETDLKWDFSHANRLRFGHYTARLVLVYDNGSRDVPMEATVSFWVVPWRVLIGLLLIALFVAIGLWSTFRRAKGALSNVRHRKKVN